MVNRNRIATVLMGVLLSIAGATAGVTLYPDIPGAERSDRFNVQANGQDIFVETLGRIDYARFKMIGPAKIQVRFNHHIETFTISPQREPVAAKQRDNTIIFEIEKPRNLAVLVNKTHWLFIFAESPEPMYKLDQRKIRYIDEQSADNTGQTLVTEKLQQAIDALPQNGWLWIRPGIYQTGTLKLKSDMTLYLSAGAMLKGSTNPNDYPLDSGFTEANTNAPKWSNNGRGMTYSRLIFIDDACNVHITGRGIIDGSGKIVRDQGKPANLIRIRNSSNITIEDIILRDPAAWNTHILHSENITVRNIKMLNRFDVANTDGINPDASTHILIENNFACCGDDCVAVKSTGNTNLLADVNDIVVRGNIFLTRKSALKVGTETRAERMSHISFIDNDVILCDRGMSLYCEDGAVFENIVFEGNYFEYNFPDNRRMLMDFRIGSRSGEGHIQNVTIKNCRAFRPWPHASIFHGLNEAHTISNVKFINLVVGDTICETPDDIPLKTNPFVEHVQFQK